MPSLAAYSSQIFSLAIPVLVMDIDASKAETLTASLTALLPSIGSKDSIVGMGEAEVLKCLPMMVSQHQLTFGATESLVLLLDWHRQLHANSTGG